MKKLLALLVIVVAVWLGLEQGPDFRDADDTITAPSGPGNRVAEAFEARDSGKQVTGSGVVARILADDNDGSRHQRFILRLGSGQTVLVAHNIDVAPRVAGLKTGDNVSFSGEYEWNARGGVVHWTHHDPDGSHFAGWLKHGGRTYQ
ncbi:MAG TPA: DUF3465 domain-containing protein [Woeseiaceae bacterium]|nr:DUF3465 domain-containing protein [Woeseiaceae bacterium]